MRRLTVSTVPAGAECVACGKTTTLIIWMSVGFGRQAFCKRCGYKEARLNDATSRGEDLGRITDQHERKERKAALTPELIEERRKRLGELLREWENAFGERKALTKEASDLCVVRNEKGEFVQPEFRKAILDAVYDGKPAKGVVETPWINTSFFNEFLTANLLKVVGGRRFKKEGHFLYYVVKSV